MLLCDYVRRHDRWICCEIAEGNFPQRGDTRQGYGGSDPGDGCGARVGQAESVVQASPAVAISRLREFGMA